MKPNVARELINILQKLDWYRANSKEELKDRLEELITDLYLWIDIREDIEQAIRKIPNSWPQPTKELFGILVDYMVPEDVNLTVSTTPEGVTIRFNKD